MENRTPIEFIRSLDHKSNAERFALIVKELETLSVDYSIHTYSTGKNIIVDLGSGPEWIGIGSHFDRVPGSGGANDNGSAIAVCLDIINRYQIKGGSAQPLRLFFFDEEETNLKGSRAYVSQFGIGDMKALINMELVGLGDQFAVWPVTSMKSTPLLNRFEQISAEKNIPTTRFDQIVTNSADHLPFLENGLDDTFTITCISSEDLRIAGEYYAALAAGKPLFVLQDIILSAPAFAHYHRPSDTSNRLDSRAIQATSDCIWAAIND